ncbi:hypothetical protein [Paenarthrobacter nicotinovorans]|uniref:hypothetical protein n=1 Tax=Paenarthrobacter nicotinovorans TaxID=29320 RepID=UPI0009CA9BDB|nr:hypothetical protein [Paenarthrobacter nicotinovorans]MDI2021176.1 hypothetical protein [Paenarthrobacter nicotinovorans]SKB67405.1 hypothetical protein SAMN05660916_02065 [Arthrobacter sp. 31Cvi3.1E]
MQISQEYAGLVAQVFPALLIAMMLEQKLLPKVSAIKRPRFYAWTGFINNLARYVAAAGAIFSTMLCLHIAAGRGSYPLAEWVVLISVYLLGGSFALTISTMAYNYCYEAWEQVQDAHAQVNKAKNRASANKTKSRTSANRAKGRRR